MPSVARTYLPPQHGAWAMLAVPFLIGTAAAGPTWLHIPIFLVWLPGYLLSYYVFQTFKARRRRPRYDRPIALYGGITAMAGLVVLAFEPALLWYALVFVPLLSVNAWYAFRRQERALANDIASVLEACVMVFVAYTAGGGDDAGRAWALFTAVLLYFTGTVLYVKTLIRERGDPRYYAASVAFHAVAFVVAALLHPVLGLLFAVYLARAVVLPRLDLRVAVTGTAEIGGALLLVVVTLMTL